MKAKSAIQPLMWYIIFSVVSWGIDFTVVRYFVNFFTLHGSMFLILESSTFNNLFAICWDYCHVCLELFFSDRLISLMQLSTSDETKFLSAEWVFDGNFSLAFWEISKRSFLGLSIVSWAMFNSLLFYCHSIAFYKGCNWFLVLMMKFLRASQFLT